MHCFVRNLFRCNSAKNYKIRLRFYKAIHQANGNVQVFWATLFMYNTTGSDGEPPKLRRCCMLISQQEQTLVIIALKYGLLCNESLTNWQLHVGTGACTEFSEGKA